MPRNRLSAHGRQLRIAALLPLVERDVEAHVNHILAYGQRIDLVTLQRTIQRLAQRRRLAVDLRLDNDLQTVVCLLYTSPSPRDTR